MWRKKPADVFGKPRAPRKFENKIPFVSLHKLPFKGRKRPWKAGHSILIILLKGSHWLLRQIIILKKARFLNRIGQFSISS